MPDVEGYRYVGEIVNGRFHGQGTAYFPDGRIYSGAWKNNERHGKGVLFTKESVVLFAHWENNKREKILKSLNSFLPECPSYSDDIWTNCLGFHRFEDGNIYAGEWQDNRFNGQGFFANPSEFHYVGNFKADEFYGLGVLSILDSGDFADRDEYVGHFKDDNFHGEGTYTVYLNDEVESVLEGVWANGEFQNTGDGLPTALAETSTDQEEIISASSGSGFAVSYDGHVITNNHVIEGCQKVIVHQKGSEVPVKVITYDPQNDLALLKGDFTPNTVFPLSNERPELLQDVYVAGYPFGKEISTSVKVTKGIISSLTGIGNNFSNIQIDAALQPGNSGGPILDDKGNLVGVAVEKLDLDYILENYGVVPEGTNFGIKSNVVRNLLDSNEVDNPAANQSEISKSKLGKMISSGTYYISCWMTAAQIQEMQSEKVMFSNLK